MPKETFLEIIKNHSFPLRDSEDLTPLLEMIGDARYVLLGEASHGTKEYYLWRFEITKRLIEEKGFNFIAVEGDWPDCYKVNQYIKDSINTRDTPRRTLEIFRRWPTWMWANEEMIDVVEWIHSYNQALVDEQKIGFYGLDIYSLWESMDELLKYFKEHDPDELRSIYEIYLCFEPYHRDARLYAHKTFFGHRSCEKQAAKLLEALRNKHIIYNENPEAYFNAEQNALIIKNAEDYYRTMTRNDTASWNIRDYHMTETVERLMKYHGENAKGIIWEHNTHIGDARATPMANAGAINIGQILRERHTPKEVKLIGFSSYSGEVIASTSWEAPLERMPVPIARKNSWEDLLHEASTENKILLFHQKLERDWFIQRGHRAIGVVYHPEHEYGNYVPTVLPIRYDGLIYLNRTHALDPLPIGKFEKEELPETFPSTF